MRDPKYDVLFEPVRIGPKVMRNRFYQTPHCSGFGSDYAGTQAEFRATKAEGGWAVVNTEYCSIHPESDDAPFIQAKLWDESDVHNLGLMVQRAHEHGSLAGVELNYFGPNHTGHELRHPARGVSQIPSARFVMHSCYEMDREEIRELQGFYVAAAERARDAGFDLILIYGAETVPITQQFLMPYFNRRSDEYGGSFENRARFTREVLELIRDALGDDVRWACASRSTRSPRTGSGSQCSRMAFGSSSTSITSSTCGTYRSARRACSTPLTRCRLPGFGPRTGRSRGWTRSARTRASRSSVSAASRTRTRWSPRSARDNSTSSARRGRRSPIRFCRARSSRGGSTRSASASAATSASAASSRAVSASCARRTRRRARSTAGVGIRRGSPCA